MAEIALFGNVQLKRAKCPECGCRSFVDQDGATFCCDFRIEDSATRWKRESLPPQKRRVPPKAAQRRILEQQEGRCFYCLNQFGTIVERGTFTGAGHRVVELKVRWDHFVPYAYSQNNETTNFVAACQLCNGFKSKKIFESVEDARLWLRRRWRMKGWSTIEI